MGFSKSAFFRHCGDCGPEELRELGALARRAGGMPLPAAEWERLGAREEQARSLELWSALRGNPEDFEAMAAGIEAAKTARVWRVKAGSRLDGQIAEGSAVATAEMEDGSLLAHYEGNIHGAENLREFKDRAARAAGRLFENYPTVAKMRLDAQTAEECLEPVGTIDSYSYQIRSEGIGERRRPAPKP